MKTKELSKRLSIIEEVLERSRIYSHNSGIAAILFGIFSLIPSIYFYRVGLNINDPTAWLLFSKAWLATLGAALLTLFAALYFTSKRHNIPFLSETVKTIGFVLSPSMFTAMLFTVILDKIGHHEYVPGVWVLCYGVGFLSASVFLNICIKVFSFIYILIGTAYLLWFTDNPHLMTMISLGIIHLVFGIFLLLGRKKERMSE